MKTLQIYIRYVSIRLLYLVFIGIVISFSFIPTFTLGDYSINNPLYTNDENMSSWLFYINYLIITFLLAIFVIVTLVIIYTYNNRQKEQLDDLYATYFVKKLFDNLYFSGENDSDKISSNNLKLLKKPLKNDHLIRLFTETLLNIHNQTIGEINKKSAIIFHSLQYEYLVTAYLKSPYLRHKLFALKVIAEFEINGYDERILKLANSKNQIIQSEAIVSLLKLKVYKNLLFLEDIKMKLSLWNINLIIKTIQELDNTIINYQKLINSNIPEVSTIGIILARLNGKREFKNEIISKIGNASEMVNEEAFLTYISFAENQADYDFLIEKIETAPQKAQLQAIKAFATSPDKPKAIKFLNHVVSNLPYLHKIEALNVLLDIDISSISRLQQSDDELIRKSCLQVLNINL